MTLSMKTKNRCDLCGSPFRPSYSMNGFTLAQCIACKSVFTIEVPGPDELTEFYEGFLFQARVENYDRVATDAVRKWMTALLTTPPGEMLDVGGGGGFFSKAFENFGLGNSTYIDIDLEACQFAREQMNISTVIHDSVENIEKHVPTKKFNFIYCRHVIEHLPNPRPFLEKCVTLLAPGGTLIVQCPNGLSKEGLLYPWYWLRFLRKIKASNGWSWIHALLFSLSSGYGWGIDPIRHLWAISGDGLTSVFADTRDISVRITTASLADPVYSPYWNCTSSLTKLSGLVARQSVGKVMEGMHLIAIVTRNRDTACLTPTSGADAPKSKFLSSI